MKDPLIVPAWVFDAWRFKVTQSARYLLYVSVLAGMGSISVMVPIYQVFCGLVGLLVVAWICGIIMSPRVTIQGRFPDKTTAGNLVTGQFQVTNRSRWPIYDIAVGVFHLPPSLRQTQRDVPLSTLPSKGTTTLPVTLHAYRRGFYELPDVQAYTLFPFGIFRSGKARKPLSPLLVLPSYHPVAGIDVPVGHRYQPGGIALTSNIGESPEYIGNREYVSGEPIRRLDFRSWARLGKPVVREFHEEYYCRIALILDTYIPAGHKPTREGFLQLEAAVSLAASVAGALSHGEYIIDIFAAGPELYVFRAGRHTAHFDNVLEILACVDACRNNPFDTISPAVSEELGNISATICVFLDWDESRQQLARQIVEAGSSLKVIIARDGETTVPLHAAEGDVSQYSVEQIQKGGLEIL